jgi:hypothetical protein
MVRSNETSKLGRKAHLNESVPGTPQSFKMRYQAFRKAHQDPAQTWREVQLGYIEYLAK